MQDLLRRNFPKLKFLQGDKNKAAPPIVEKATVISAPTIHVVEGHSQDSEVSFSEQQSSESSNSTGTDLSNNNGSSLTQTFVHSHQYDEHEDEAVDSADQEFVHGTPIGTPIIVKDTSQQTLDTTVTRHTVERVVPESPVRTNAKKSLHFGASGQTEEQVEKNEADRAAVREGKEEGAPPAQQNSSNDAPTPCFAVYFENAEEPEFIQSLDGKTLIYTKDIHPKNIADAIKTYQRAIATYPKIRRISQIYIPLDISHSRDKKPNLYLTISNGTFFATADIEDPKPRETSDTETLEDNATSPITKNKPYEKQFLEALRVLRPDIEILYSNEKSFFLPDTPFTPSPNASVSFVDSDDDEAIGSPRALPTNDNRIVKCTILRDGNLPGLLDDIKIKEFNQDKLDETHQAYAKKKIERLRALGRENPYQTLIRREFTSLNFIVDLDTYLKKNKPNIIARFFGFLFQTTSYKNYTNASNYLEELSQEWLDKKVASEKKASAIETLNPLGAISSSAEIETYVRTNLNPDQKKKYYSVFSNLRVPENAPTPAEQNTKADRFITYAHNLGIARVKGHR